MGLFDELHPRGVLHCTSRRSLPHPTNDTQVSALGVLAAEVESGGERRRTGVVQIPAVQTTIRRYVLLLSRAFGIAGCGVRS